MTDNHPSIEQTVIRMALETLTIRQKQIWEMYAYDRVTQEEIGNVLGIQEKAVEKHLKAIELKVKKFCKQNRAAYMLLKLEHKIMNEETE